MDMDIQQYLKDMGEKISLLKEAEEVNNSFICDNTRFSLTEIQSIQQGTYFDITFNELKQLISLITGCENEIDNLYSIIERVPLNRLLGVYKDYNECIDYIYQPLDEKRKGRKRTKNLFNQKSYKEKPLTDAQIWKEKRRTVNDINLCKRCYVCKNPLFIKFDEYIEKMIDDEVVYIHNNCLEFLKE